MINYKNSQTARAIRLLFVCAFLYNFLGCYTPYTIYPLKGPFYDSLIVNNPGYFSLVTFIDLQVITKPNEIVDTNDVYENLILLKEKTKNELNRILHPKLCYPIIITNSNFQKLERNFELTIKQIDSLNKESGKMTRSQIRGLYKSGKLDSLRTEIINNVIVDRWCFNDTSQMSKFNKVILLNIKGEYKSKKKQRYDNWNRILSPSGGASSGDGVLNLFIIDTYKSSIDYYYKKRLYNSPQATIAFALEEVFKEYLIDIEKSK